MKTKTFSARLAGIFLFGGIWTVSVEAQPTDQLQENIPPEQVMRLEEARELRKNGEYSAAIKELEQILSRTPNYYNAQLNLALAYYNDNEHMKALASFDKALAIKETEGIEDYKIFNTIGWVNLENGDFEEAERYFKLALDHEEKLSTRTRRVLYNNVGLLYLYLNNLERAEEYLKKAEDYGNQGAAKNLEIVRASRAAQKADTPSSTRERLKAHVEWSIVQQGAQLRKDGKLLPIDLLRERLLATQPEGKLGYQQIVEASDQDLVSAVREVLEELPSDDPAR